MKITTKLIVYMNGRTFQKHSPTALGWKAMVLAGLALASPLGASEYNWNSPIANADYTDPSNWLVDGNPAITIPGATDNIGAPTQYGSGVRLSGNLEANDVILPLTAGWGLMASNSNAVFTIHGDFGRSGSGAFYFGNSTAVDPGITTPSKLSVKIEGDFLGGGVNFGNSNRALESVIVEGESKITGTVLVNSPDAQFRGGLNFDGGSGIFIKLGGGSGGITTSHLVTTSYINGQQVSVANIGGSGTGTLTLNGNSGTWTYGGELRNANGANNSAYTLNIIKTGSNTQILSRAQGQVYSGSTVITAGTLVVNNTANSGLGTGAVEIRDGGVLGGTGIIQLGGANTLTVKSGGVLAPGEQIGALRLSGLNTTAAALTLESGAEIAFDLGSGNQSDAVNFLNYAGAIDFVRGGATVLNFSDAQEGTYELFHFYSNNGTTLTSAGFTEGTSGFVLGSGLDGYEAVWDYSQTGVIKLSLTAVPEPASLGLLAGGLIFVAAARRSRRSTGAARA